MPEVAGNAAIQISPDDPAAIADAISHVIDDDTLRQRLIKAGYHRCKDFSWKHTAERTVEVFAEACP
jgi:glycosyltransferase involved in cell wall biosynthesis